LSIGILLINNQNSSTSTSNAPLPINSIFHVAFVLGADIPPDAGIALPEITKLGDIVPLVLNSRSTSSPVRTAFNTVFMSAPTVFNNKFPSTDIDQLLTPGITSRHLPLSIGEVLIISTSKLKLQEVSHETNSPLI